MNWTANLYSTKSIDPISQSCSCQRSLPTEVVSEKREWNWMKLQVNLDTSVGYRTVIYSWHLKHLDRKKNWIKTVARSRSSIHLNSLMSVFREWFNSEVSGTKAWEIEGGREKEMNEVRERSWCNWNSLNVNQFQFMICIIMRLTIERRTGCYYTFEQY